MDASCKLKTIAELCSYSITWQDASKLGIRTLLHGHEDAVNAVKFFPQDFQKDQILLSGSADKSLRVWQIKSPNYLESRQITQLRSHTASINCIAVSPGIDLFASGAADGTVKLWEISSLEGDVRVENVQSLQLTPKFFPLALAVHRLLPSDDLILAVAGTKNFIQIFLASENGSFSHQATLLGHEGWVRSLAFTDAPSGTPNETVLASASQDKYIRLWKIAKTVPKSTPKQSSFIIDFERTLSNKVYKLNGNGESYMLTFEALLLGHDDWIYSVAWSTKDDRLRLLSASEDSSLAIWESEETSGVWIPTVRLGEVSRLKGSTTATGSAGGFWIGMWSPSGMDLVTLGRTGSWRLWGLDESQGRWFQRVGISGHTRSVTDISWSRSGSYLLSTSSDQTTRLHALWENLHGESWHEMGRPQIHGYDLNCLDCISDTRFVSGADEKLLRVFDEPQATADSLAQLSGIISDKQENLPSVANIPVLGLSNKAPEPTDPGEGSEAAVDHDNEDAGLAEAVSQDGQNPKTAVPPDEDQLGRRTLWPEREKLYGHGHEISAVAVSHDGSIMATSCKATSQEHAVIRLYTTHDWREVDPPLMAHSLTVTALRFSPDDSLMLSVGRDRQWVLWERTKDLLETYRMARANPRGHARMILNACWAPQEAEHVFATAGRDKVAKLWSGPKDSEHPLTTIGVDNSSIMAIDSALELVDNAILLALGAESGNIDLVLVDRLDWTIVRTHRLDQW